MKLSLYNKKRNFKKTREPKGKISHQYKNLYVIQKHAASHLHYDFRLELNGVLLSWAVPKGPCLDPSIKRLAMHVEDHPVEYGQFEGIIPKGQYGGGTVMLWDTGTWVSEDENPTAAYQKGHLRFYLQGKKLKGRWSLIRFKKDDKAWFLIKSKDQYARSLKDCDVTLEKPNSVLSKLNLEEITENYQKVWGKKGLEKKPKLKTPKLKKKPKINLPRSLFPAEISPELATLVEKAPEGDEWLHEIKFDGYRILAFKKGNDVRLMSRNHKNWTRYFKNIANIIKKSFVKNIILDGEMVLLDKDKRSSFQMLQNAIEAEEEKPFIYFIFDILYYDKYDVTSLSLLERKKLLRALLIAINNPFLQFSEYTIGNGPETFKSACQMSLEGIISKNIASPYEQRRTKNWLKIKSIRRQEFVIGGFSPPQGARDYFGSLYLGYFNEQNQFIYCGNVGTGFNHSLLKDIYSKLKKNITLYNPFSIRPHGVTTATWVKPVLVCEVEFTEWTAEGSLRHPSFKGLRTDKNAKLIRREMEMKTENVAIKAFKLTHPDKILYPEDKITKLDIAKYYEKIQKWILPYIVNRPLTIVRCPDGYKECFYQKHITNTTPKSLYGKKIKEKDKISNCIYIKNLEGLMALVQMGSLEIHSWGSKIEAVEYPDIMTFDLDPAPDVSWKKLVIAAKQIRDYLKKYKLKSFVKTTGGKGLHIVVPIEPEYQWDQVKEFAHSFVNFLVSEHPKEYIGEMAKKKRTGKIFVDYMRNQRGATAVSAYSTRARPGAPVSVPVGWNELTNKREDTAFTMQTLPNRLAKLKKDPWKDFFKVKQSLRL